MDRTTVSDATLTKLRGQAELQALHDNAKPEWRELTQALAELEERRQKDKQETTNGHE